MGKRKKKSKQIAKRKTSFVAKHIEFDVVVPHVEVEDSRTQAKRAQVKIKDLIRKIAKRQPFVITGKKGRQGRQR